MINTKRFKVSARPRNKYIDSYGSNTTTIQTSSTGSTISSGASNLVDLDDVQVSNVKDKNVLLWDDALSLWKNHQLTKSDIGLSNVDNLSRAQLFNNPYFTGTTKSNIIEIKPNPSIDPNAIIWTNASSLQLNKWGGTNEQRLILHDTFTRLDSNYFNINAPETACNNLHAVGDVIITGDTTVEGKFQTASKAIFEVGAAFYGETTVGGQFNAKWVDTNELVATSIYTDDSECIIDGSGADVWGCFSSYGDETDYQSDYSVWGSHKVFGITKLEADYIDCQDLNVRGNLNVYELTANKVRSTNGYLYVTDSDTITEIVAGGLILRVKFKEGNFRIGDIILTQYRDGDNWVSAQYRISTELDGIYSLMGLTQSSTSIKVNDYFVRVDSASDDDRKSGILLSPYDGSYIDFYKGNGNGQDKTVMTSIGDLNHLNKEGVSGYGLYSDNAYLRGRITATEGNLQRINVGEEAGIWGEPDEPSQGGGVPRFWCGEGKYAPFSVNDASEILGNKEYSGHYNSYFIVDDRGVVHAMGADINGDVEAQRITANKSFKRKTTIIDLSKPTSERPPFDPQNGNSYTFIYNDGSECNFAFEEPDNPDDLDGIQIQVVAMCTEAEGAIILEAFDDRMYPIRSLGGVGGVNEPQAFNIVYNKEIARLTGSGWVRENKH